MAPAAASTWPRGTRKATAASTWQMPRSAKQARGRASGCARSQAGSGGGWAVHPHVEAIGQRAVLAAGAAIEKRGCCGLGLAPAAAVQGGRALAFRDMADGRWLAPAGNCGRWRGAGGHQETGWRERSRAGSGGGGPGENKVVHCQRGSFDLRMTPAGRAVGQIMSGLTIYPFRFAMHDLCRFNTSAAGTLSRPVWIAPVNKSINRALSSSRTWCATRQNWKRR